MLTVQDIILNHYQLKEKSIQIFTEWNIFCGCTMQPGQACLLDDNLLVSEMFSCILLALYVV